MHGDMGHEVKEVPCYLVVFDCRYELPTIGRKVYNNEDGA